MDVGKRGEERKGERGWRVEGKEGGDRRKERREGERGA